MNWVTHSSFYSQSSKHHNSQTVMARDLKFWDNVHHPLCDPCNMSHVTCHMTEKNIYIWFFSSFSKWWSYLVEGLFSTGPTPSSCQDSREKVIEGLVFPYNVVVWEDQLGSHTVIGLGDSGLWVPDWMQQLHGPGCSGTDILCLHKSADSPTLWHLAQNRWCPFEVIWVTDQLWGEPF